MAIKKYEEFQKERVNEELGIKDIGIAAALLLNTVFGTANAEKLSDDQLKSKIISYSNDKSVINSLEDKGVVNAADLLKKNAAEIVKNIKDRSTLSGKTGEEAAKLVRQGWAITGHQIDTIMSEVKKSSPGGVMVPIDSIVINYDAGNAFEPGRFILKESVKKEISDTLSYIHSKGIYISEVNVESSTDKQRVSPGLVSELKTILGSDSTDNDNNNLSKVRNDVMKKYINNTFAQHGNAPSYTQTILFEKGKGELGAATPQDASARYVKITLYGVCCDNSISPPTSETSLVSNIVETFKLSKTSTSRNISPPIKYGKVSHKVGKISIDNCNGIHKAFRGSH